MLTHCLHSTVALRLPHSQSTYYLAPSVLPDYSAFKLPTVSALRLTTFSSYAESTTRLTQTKYNAVLRRPHCWSTFFSKPRLYCPCRLASTMSTAATESGDDEYKARRQQSMLASQRQKASDNSTPTEANRRGQFGGYFPLGYKEGFQQWVTYMRT